MRRIAKHAQGGLAALEGSRIELGLVDEETFNRVVKPEGMLGAKACKTPGSPGRPSIQFPGSSFSPYELGMAHVNAPQR